ncbi:DNA-binding protein [Saccharothrix sp. NRRL B-16348]|uniref:septation protein SepH n=1 Tax=Saccharothrix sp. NRRL B-16348 TaxID=1415542 RepID=UPI0006B058CE|nr:septation protein SepH [Saccharothrix sp. NRRL B-16348]KOX22671.1 DNA-binding protein [Saccharothrix sp. NRRL B-16348]
MRALRVIGLEDDGKSVILEDPDRGERFVLPADERLRAAARGDLTRLGQIEIEVESQMRPREIQARIRAGESVAQVAAAAGLPAHRVERYAYPVLLERSRTAELAQRAHPVREDGPDVQTLGEVVAHSFGLRGQEYADVSWDSWRGEDGRWVVQLHWTAGRSDNLAHWAFHPGAQGGTVTALDDGAMELMDPNPNRTLRTVRPVTQLARQALELEKQQDPEPEILAREEPAPPPPPPPVQEPQPTPDPVPVAEEPADTPPPVPKQPAAGAKQQPPRKDPPPKRGKKNHPIVPSWEDVLLGVRSTRG